MVEPLTIETERLRLRAWRPTDREPFAALNADPVVMEMLPSVLARAESDAFADRIETGLTEWGWGLWAVEVRDGPPFVGYVGLDPPTFDAPFTPCVEIGWRLAQEAWGRGIATEAARAALDVAFATIGLDEVVSFTAIQNHRSRRVMERIGMAHDPAEDFDHPRLPVGHRLRRHVLYRVPNPARP